MKQFIYKTLIAVVAIVLVYELTIAKQIKEFTSQSEVLMTKEGRKDGVNTVSYTHLTLPTICSV